MADRRASRGESTRVRGAAPATVTAALESGDPLPGTPGFAGLVDSRLVRDLLGREPLFVETDRTDSEAPRNWAFDPATLAEPRALPAGSVRDVDTGDTRRAWTLPDPDPTRDRDATVAAVREAVLSSVKEVPREVADDPASDDHLADDPASDGVAVAFSGGIDSALVATGVPNAPCYVVGFEGCHDVATAREAATEMDRDLSVVHLSHEDLRRAVPEVVRATGRANAMDVQIALPLYLVAEAVAADGFQRLLLGQGADELFGGYAKVVDPAGDDRVEAATVRGATREVVGTLPGQLERDVLAVRAAGVDPVTPLLHDRVVDAALRLPGPMLATPDERKVALRRAARGVLPDTIRTTEKKAVQYGSYVARELDRLARQAGFKRRQPNHVDRYVEALVAGDGP